MYTVALTNRFDNIIESHVFDTHEDAVDTINNIKDYIEKNNIDEVKTITLYKSLAMDEITF